MAGMIEHPDIAAALTTGYPTCTPPENADSEENRLEYIRDHAKELIDWLMEGDPEALADFIAHRRWDYDNWLN